MTSRIPECRRYNTVGAETLECLHLKDSMQRALAGVLREGSTARCRASWLAYARPDPGWRIHCRGTLSARSVSRKVPATAQTVARALFKSKSSRGIGMCMPRLRHRSRCWLALTTTLARMPWHAFRLPKLVGAPGDEWDNYRLVRASSRIVSLALATRHGSGSFDGLSMHSLTHAWGSLN